MPRLYFRLLFIVVLVMCLGAETVPDGRLYQSSDDPLADVQQALGRAGDNDRLALVVLGANWCHDSRALAARLHQPPLAEVIEEDYELVFVDVGFYEIDRDVVMQLGAANYYATPTVLIMDPASGRPINDEDRHIWTNAYSIDMPASVEYFEKWAALQRLYAEIDEFEQQQAERVTAGYAVVGPMLEATVAGNRPEAFDASWDELAAFRTAIPDDVLELRDEAQRRVAAGEEDIQLEYPEYPVLSWESE